MFSFTSSVDPYQVSQEIDHHEREPNSSLCHRCTNFLFYLTGHWGVQINSYLPIFRWVRQTNSLMISHYHWHFRSVSLDSSSIDSHRMICSSLVNDWLQWEVFYMMITQLLIPMRQTLSLSGYFWRSNTISV